QRDGRPEEQERRPFERPRGAAGALIELDRDLMKLLVRRATLVSRIRGGRDHAASPAAIQDEKAVRIAWETGALAFSKDPRFSRELFALLQDLKVLSREQAQNMGSFHLSPPQKPVSGLIAGPTSTRSAQMYVALASALNRDMRLTRVMLSSALMDTVKSFAQAGSDVGHRIGGANIGSVSVSRGKEASFTDKNIYVGEDLFSLYLCVFFSLSRPGSCRLSGGGPLRGADLTALRQALPLFGARLAHVVPHTHGLPANLECSGQIPSLVVVPPDLPFDGLCALLLAPLFWNQPMTLDLGALPAAYATAALAEVGPLHTALGADVESHGPRFVYAPTPLHLPEEPLLPLDPALCAYLLALPAFTGGVLGLRGHWPAHLPEARETADLLNWAGIGLEINEEGVRAAPARAPFALPLQSNNLAPALGPLFLALCALYRHRADEIPPLERLASFPGSDTDSALAGDFFSRLGLTLDKGRLEPSFGQGDPQSPAWTSPDAFWSMAYALAAFVRPGLALANPGNVSPVLPPFWSIYNSLPEPRDPASPLDSGREGQVEESAGDKPARRRIIAD
ncbi:hypothetical protein LJC59_05905, partial [Desulfovibrio sp. OttesenSCG-928-A18]|nr:hypothetical protein [Desulfovibrio sp. OttesenSCG-928-A18]